MENNEQKDPIISEDIATIKAELSEYKNIVKTQQDVIKQNQELIKAQQATANMQISVADPVDVMDADEKFVRETLEEYDESLKYGREEKGYNPQKPQDLQKLSIIAERELNGSDVEIIVLKLKNEEKMFGSDG